jgi:hypothetical protein
MPDWLIALYAWQKKVCCQQQAWCWWYRQNTLQSHDIAEAIRDGPLQQAFALRRSLETAGWQPSEPALSSTTHTAPEISPEQAARWLEVFQSLYQTLVRLSDQLSPPFVTDSLPLALQFTLKNFTLKNQQPANSTLNFDLKVIPADWSLAHSDQNQAVLSTVTSLLTLLLPTSDLTQPVILTLNCENALNILTIHLPPAGHGPSLKTAELAEIQHLKEIFYSLTAGQLAVDQTATSLMGHLCWQNEGSACLVQRNATQ